MTIGHQDNSELSGSCDKPFVCHSYPYISGTVDQSLPIVGLKMPIVRNSGCQSGFTVVELMITLVVAAILFGIAIPNLRTFIQNSRMTSQSNDVVGELALARSEAIKLNQNVVVCRSANSTATPPACGGAGGWEAGWITFMDFGTVGAPGNTTYSVADGDVLIRQHEALSGDITMTDSDGTIADKVIFTSSGQSSSLTSRPYLKLCDSRGAGYARAIIFEPTGRAHIVQPSSTGFPAGLTCP